MTPQTLMAFLIGCWVGAVSYSVTLFVVLFTTRRKAIIDRARDRERP